MPHVVWQNGLLCPTLPWRLQAQQSVSYTVSPTTTHTTDGCCGQGLRVVPRSFAQVVKSISCLRDRTSSAPGVGAGSKLGKGGGGQSGGWDLCVTRVDGRRMCPRLKTWESGRHFGLFSPGQPTDHSGVCTLMYTTIAMLLGCSWFKGPEAGGEASAS